MLPAFITLLAVGAVVDVTDLAGVGVGQSDDDLGAVFDASIVDDGHDLIVSAALDCALRFGGLAVERADGEHDDASHRLDQIGLARHGPYEFAGALVAPVEPDRQEQVDLLLLLGGAVGIRKVPEQHLMVVVGMMRGKVVAFAHRTQCSENDALSPQSVSPCAAVVSAPSMPRLRISSITSNVCASISAAEPIETSALAPATAMDWAGPPRRVRPRRSDSARRSTSNQAARSRGFHPSTSSLIDSSTFISSRLPSAIWRSCSRRMTRRLNSKAPAIPDSSDSSQARARSAHRNFLAIRYSVWFW